MKLRMLFGALLAVAPLASAAAMPVSTFLAKADGVKRKGPLAIFSGDLKLLMKQIKQDSAQLRAENEAASSAGRPKAFCTPNGGVKLSDKDIVAAMQMVPAAERSRTSTKHAMRNYLSRRFPCRA